MNEHLQALQQTLAQEIPITQYMGITVESYDDRGLILKAPLVGNTNPKGTAFAGSINALLTLAGWGQTWLILKELDGDGDVVIQDSNIRYIRPVSGDFAALCHKPDQENIARLEQSLRKRGKARLELSAEIYQRDVVAVEFKGRYVVHLSKVTSLSSEAISACNGLVKGF
jgi:thioesterase domain-containing protein